MSLSDLALLLFSLTMIANVIALVRHWRLMRSLRLVLNDLIESQQQFHDIVMEYGKRKKP